MSKNQLLYATAIIAISQINASWAQDAADYSDTGRVLEQIIVTAQKRTQNLQDVPVSISVVTGDVILKAGSPRLDDLSTFVPNLQVNQDTISDRISIRGIGSGEQAGFEQSVGTFVDGVYRGRGVQSRFAFMDIEAVEVLRGPQGTLFGKNTIAGALNIRSARPTDDFEAAINAAYTPRFEQTEISGFISGPITDTFRARAAFQSRSMNEGWVRNAVTGRDNPDLSEWAGRIGADWDIGADTTLSFKYERAEWNNVGAPFEHVEAGPLTALGVEGDLDFSIVQSDIDPTTGLSDPVQDFGAIQAFKGNSDEARLSVEHEFGNGGTLSAIAAYSHYDYDRPTDADFSPVSLVGFEDGETQEQTTFELRYASDTGDALEYIFGAFYLNSDLRTEALSTASIPTFFALTTAGCAGGDPTLDAGVAFSCATSAGVAPLFGLLPGVARFGELDQNTEAWALFGQATWQVFDTLRATGGLRYTSEKKTGRQAITAVEYQLGDPIQTMNPVSQAVSEQLFEFTSHDFDGLRRKENRVTWSANLQWDVRDDIMAYATASTGFKAGGFNTYYMGLPSGGGADPSDVEFEDEKALAFEIGTKMTLFNGSAELNLAAFYTEYKNLQVAVFSGNTTFSVENAADATTKGVEMDLRWQVADDLLLTAGAAYTDFTFDEFPNQACTNAQFLQFRQALFDGDLGPAAAGLTAADCAAAGVNDLQGRTTVDTPEVSLNLSADYERNVGSFIAGLWVNYSYNGSVFRQGDLDPILKANPTHIINTNLRIRPETGPWEVGLLIKNLTNENQITSGIDVPLSFGALLGTVMAPRSVALTAALRF